MHLSNDHRCCHVLMVMPLPYTRSNEKGLKCFAVFAIQLHFYETLCMILIVDQQSFHWSNMFSIKPSGIFSIKSRRNFVVFQTFFKISSLTLRIFAVIYLWSSSMESTNVQHLFDLRCPIVKSHRASDGDSAVVKQLVLAFLSNCLDSYRSNRILLVLNIMENDHRAESLYSY